MYGADADTWIAARNKLLDKDSLKVFYQSCITTMGFR